MYIAFRLYGIWDHRKSAIKTIIGSFVVCYIPFLVFGIISVRDYIRECIRLESLLALSQSYTFCDFQRTPSSSQYRPSISVLSPSGLKPLRRLGHARCVLPSVAALSGLLILPISICIQLAFDCFTIGHAVANNLHRPRRHNSDLVQGLRRDGAMFFVVSFP